MKRVYVFFVMLIALSCWLNVANARVVHVPDPNLAAVLRHELGLAPNAPITRQAMQSLTFINAQSHRIREITGQSGVIRDITGLEHATKLTELYLNDNQISDIRPLARLRNLVILRISNNQVSNLRPLTGLTQLRNLDIDRNAITNFQPLARLTQLRDLSITVRRISDLRRSVDLTQLEHLGIHGDGININDLHLLSSLTQLKGLVVMDAQIKDLRFLESLTQLTDLQLPLNQIRDVTPLSGLTQLTGLYLPLNQIRDVTPLSGLTQLTGLGLWGNRIRDVTPLSGLTQLTFLYLNNNQIRDVTPIAGLINLRHLYLKHNPIQDASPLANLPNINYTDIDIPEPQDSDVMDLPDMPVVHVNLDQLPPMYWQSSWVSLSRLVRGEVERDFVQADGYIKGFAVDSVNDNIYWIEDQNPTGVGTGSRIRRVNLDGSNRQILATLKHHTHFSITVDPKRKKLYWARAGFDRNALDIMQSNLNGKSIKNPYSHAGVSLQSHLFGSVDVVGTKLIVSWRQNSSHGASYFIANSDLNFKNFRLIVNSQHGTSTPAISGGKIYWIETSDLSLDENHEPVFATGEIRSANLDGSNVKILVKLEGPVAEHLAVDSARKKLYWTDNSGDVWRTNLNGKNRQQVLSGMFVAPGTLQGFALGNSRSMAAAPVNITVAPPPEATQVLANYPNPFNPETWIPYHLAEPANVMVRIYAADGILVQTLILGHQPAGMYQSRVRAAYWDGRNALGEPVASGIYFYTFTAGDFTATRKMLIRK